MTKEEQYIAEGTMLPLIEEFYSLQGEGYNTGKAAYFIRLGGCDIGCSWCDTKFSWDADFHKLTSVDEIVKKAAGYPAKAIVVTGGEPTCYNMHYLCEQLILNGVKTFLETSGVYKLTGEWHWICLSPKKHNPPVKEIYPLASELKVIISEPDDLIWAEENAIKTDSKCKLFLQPEWSVYKTIIYDVVEYIKQNPKWQISLQSHKFMKIP